jgi:NAD(P)H-hydrate epimerase
LTLSGLRTLDPDDLLVDAILGTGFRGELSPELSCLITAMNESPARIVAIDLPSGLTADRGEVAPPAVKASLTVTMAYPKRSFFLLPARTHVGEWTVADIGIPR